LVCGRLGDRLNALMTPSRRAISFTTARLAGAQKEIERDQAKEEARLRL
jgi:hypothetical protein